MSLQTFEIEERYKLFQAQIPQLGDFTTRKSGTISPQELLENPHITLYCLDPEKENAVFVETPSEVNLSQVPFYYMGQFEHATRVILVPYHDFHQLAQQVPLEGDQLMLVYSVGRSGSTLTSMAFNQAEGVIGLSEPDVFTQLVALRAWDGKNDSEISGLLKSCTHLTCKNPDTTSKPQKWAIKFRSYGIEIGDLMYQHFPEAKCLFLYRNLEAWTESMVRAFGGDQAITPEILTIFWDFMQPLVRIDAAHAVGHAELSIAQVFGLHWLSPMERYLELNEKGIPMLSVKYDDMKKHTLPVMEKIFSYCDLVTKDRNELKQVLAQDSQAGTLIARDFTQAQQFENKGYVLKELHELLTSRPIVNRVDFTLPNTLTLE